MSLTLDSITEISRAVALEHGSALEIVGVTSSDGGSDRVEILVTITGCHQEPLAGVVAKYEVVNLLNVADPDHLSR